MSSPIAPAAPAHAAPFQILLALAGAAVIAAGVLVFDWPVFYVIVTYWVENVVIGIANVVRMLVAGARGGVALFVGALFMVFFFSVHYGMFTFVHGIFVFGFFAPKELRPGGPFDLILGLVEIVLRDGWLGVAFLVTALAVAADTRSWVRATRAQATGPEGKNADVLKPLMMAPYGRVIVLHLTLLIGAAAAAFLNAPAAAAVLLVALKLGFDLVRLQAPAAETMKNRLLRRGARAP